MRGSKNPIIPFRNPRKTKTNDIWIGDNMDEKTYNSLPHEGFIIWNHKQARCLAKEANAIVGCFRRRIRTLKRQKEKERRRRLKGGAE